MRNIILILFMVLSAGLSGQTTLKNSSIAVQDMLDNTVPFEFNPIFRYDTTAMILYVFDDGSWTMLADGSSGGGGSVPASNVTIVDAGGIIVAADAEDAFQELATNQNVLDARTDDLNTLSGVATNATDLGAFTGSTISDNVDNKVALQELETAVELGGGGGATVYFDNVASLSGATLSVGDIAITKGFSSIGDGGGATFYVQSLEPPSYPADEIAVVTVSSGFAVMEATGGSIKGASFFVNNQSVDYKDEIQGILNFASLKKAKITWPNFEVDWFIDTNTAGATTFNFPDNTNIEGSGSASAIKLMDGSTIYDSWFYTDSDSISIKGMRFEGNKQNTTSDNEQTHLFDLSAGDNTNWIIKDSYFNNFRRDAFKMLSISNIYFENCHFDGCQRAALVFQRAVYNAHVYSCSFKNGGDGHVDFEPTGAVNSNNVYIRDCVFGSYLQGAGAISISSPSSSVPVTNLHLSGCTFEQGGIYGAGQMEGYTIENNTFEFKYKSDNNEIPFRIIKAPDRFIMRNNTFMLTDSFPSATTIVSITSQITEPKNVEITGNSFYAQRDTIPTCIKIGDALSAIVKDNKFYLDSALYVNSIISLVVDNDLLDYPLNWTISSNKVYNDAGGTDYCFVTNIRNDTIQSINVSKNTLVLKDVNNRVSFYNHQQNKTNAVVNHIVSNNDFIGNVSGDKVSGIIGLLNSDQNATKGSGIPVHLGKANDSYKNIDDGIDYLYDPIGLSWVEKNAWWKTGVNSNDLYANKEVGINTTSPKTNLDVNGRGLIRSTLTVGSSSVITSSVLSAYNTSSPNSSVLTISGNRSDQAVNRPMFTVIPTGNWGLNNNPDIVDINDLSGQAFAVTKGGETIVNRSGGIATTITGRDTDNKITDVVVGAGLEFTAGVINSTVKSGGVTISDLTTLTTPIVVVGGAGYTQLTNDAAGSQTDENFYPSGISDQWDEVTGNFDWSELTAGDQVNIRITGELTTSSPNTQVEIILRNGIGGTSYDITFLNETNYKNAGTHHVSEFSGFVALDSNTIDNGSMFMISSDTNCDFEVTGWYIQTIRR